MSTTIALGAHPSTTLTRFAPARLPRPPFSGNFSGKVGVRESWGRGKAKADLGRLGVGEILDLYTDQENLQGDTTGVEVGV